MSKFIIEKSPPLNGRVRISGGKNSALPILAAAMMSPGKCVVHEVPALSDVLVMQNIIESLGGRTEWDKNGETMSITADGIKKCEAEYELVSKIRASFLILGPLLARFKRVKTPLPGGCAIGSRPVDLHLKGIAALGAEITCEHGYVEVSAEKLKGASIYLDFPSVGATENIMMAAVFAEGQTIIQNAAVEPEIVDLANFLTSIGADIRGTGMDTIKINGVNELRGGEYTIIPDRIEAGTFMALAAATRGDVVIENVVTDHLKPVTAKLREINALVEEGDGFVRVCASEAELKATDVKTLPYPGFPTDMQAQFMAVLSSIPGTSVIIETVFENRFMHAGELKRMGADIKIDSRTAVIEGSAKLTGCPVKATDLRAGAALITAALTAEGLTEVGDIAHIDRGYSGIDEKLRRLGARIIRAEE